MKYTITILIIAATLISCNTTRQVQMQRGTYEIINNRINFVPVESWHKLETDMPDTIFRLRNAAVRKEKIKLTYND